jgi:hypothetical protein
LKVTKIADESVKLDGTSKKSVVLTVSATADAGTKNHVVGATATPEKGDAVTLDVKFDDKQK